MPAFETEKPVIAKVLCAVYKEFEYINNDTVSD